MPSDVLVPSTDDRLQDLEVLHQKYRFRTHQSSHWGLLLYFDGTGQSNYAFEMLYLKRLTSTKARDKELRRPILSNSIVNLHGRRETWQEVDRSLEYLNLELKKELWAP